ncbi:MAG: ABC transporter permease subunit, partial [Rhizobiaceae bacterium]|nr:ABC transporter permease subunit [Rhizobiaceae bacterium]
MSASPKNTDHRLVRGLRIAFSRYWGVMAVLLVWQGWVSITGVNAIVMPPPASVIADIFTSPGVYLQNGGQTLLLAALGLVIGMALGTLIAVIAWTSRVMSGILVPLSLIFSSVPVVTLIPVLARIFGYDVKTVLAIVVIISFFPAFVFTSAGLKALPPGSDDLFTVLGASS